MSHHHSEMQRSVPCKKLNKIKKNKSGFFSESIIVDTTSERGMEGGRITMDVFLGDAMGPDERGQPTHIPLEHALVDREVEDVTRQNDRILVVVADDCVDRCRVAVNIVRVQLLLLLLQ